jgi:hypothetical protein
MAWGIFVGTQKIAIVKRLVDRTEGCVPISVLKASSFFQPLGFFNRFIAHEKLA